MIMNKSEMVPRMHAFNQNQAESKATKKAGGPFSALTYSVELDRLALSKASFLKCD